MTPKGKYDGSRSLANPDEVAPLALATLIAAGGNVAEATRRMKREHGLKVPRALLASWRDRDPLRYEEMRRELAPRLEATLVGDVLDNAIRATEVERQSIDKTEQGLQGTADPMVLSTVARNMSQVRTQAVDKRLALEGRPTQIRETRSVDDLVRTLEGLGVVHKEPVIEAEAITEGQDGSSPVE